MSAADYEQQVRDFFQSISDPETGGYTPPEVDHQQIACESSQYIQEVIAEESASLEELSHTRFVG